VSVSRRSTATVLQCVLQCVAVRCSVLQRVSLCKSVSVLCRSMGSDTHLLQTIKGLCRTVCCSVLQCVAAGLFSRFLEDSLGIAPSD